VKLFRIALLAGGIFTMLLALGYFLQWPLVSTFWPWRDAQFSDMFAIYILAAISATMLWTGWAGKPSALPGGIFNILAVTTIVSIYFLVFAFQEDRPSLLFYEAIKTIALALASGAVFLWSRRVALPNILPIPWPLRSLFGVFLLAPGLAGAASNGQASPLLVCIFLGNVGYFLYWRLFPRWHNNTLGQLPGSPGFLVYVMLLIAPFVWYLAVFAGELAYLLGIFAYLGVLMCGGMVEMVGGIMQASNAPINPETRD
jgi:hypothetical protein